MASTSTILRRALTMKKNSGKWWTRLERFGNCEAVILTLRLTLKNSGFSVQSTTVTTMFLKKVLFDKAVLTVSVLFELPVKDSSLFWMRLIFYINQNKIISGSTSSIEANSQDRGPPASRRSEFFVLLKPSICLLQTSDQDTPCTPFAYSNTCNFLVPDVPKYSHPQRNSEGVIEGLGRLNRSRTLIRLLFGNSICDISVCTVKFSTNNFDESWK